MYVVLYICATCRQEHYFDLDSLPGGAEHCEYCELCSGLLIKATLNQQTGGNTMKIKKQELKTAKTGYLYEDGHLVLIHSKRDRDAGEVKWATIYEDIGIKCRYSDGGRLILDRSVLSFLGPATRIEAKAASISRGSENTKRLGISVGSVSFYNGASYDGWHINLFPDVLASDIQYQVGHEGKFDPKVQTWSIYPVKAIYSSN